MFDNMLGGTIHNHLLNSAFKNKVMVPIEVNKIASKMGIEASAVTQYIQYAFLKSDSEFVFDLISSRDSKKILSLEKIDNEEYDQIVTNLINKCKVSQDEAKFITNQFYKKLNIYRILNISIFHSCLIEYIGLKNETIFIDIDTNIDNISNNIVKNRLSTHELKEVLYDIKKYGYVFNSSDDKIMWKIYQPKAIIDEDIINKFFSVQSTDAIQTKKENVEVDLTLSNGSSDEATKQAVLLIAKKLNIDINQEEKSVLKELVAMMNELVDNFNEMPDWEKLMKWKDFVSTWTKISKEALNDRD